MIELYFEETEETVQSFPDISSYVIHKKIYNSRQGFISGSVIFEDSSRLDFAEVKDSGLKEKTKYRYHYMNKEGGLIFRYDNAPHHKNIRTFPHHKHISDDVRESCEPTLYEILLEISQKAFNHEKDRQTKSISNNAKS